MPWDITVAGTLHIDDITTPHGHRPRLCGGSALYFSLVAAPLAPLHLVAVVGEDGVEELWPLLEGLGDLSGISRSPHPTARWRATHDFEHWIAIEGEAPVPPEESCEARWDPRLPTAAAAAPVLFLGSLPVQLQLRVLEQSEARLIGSDSMTIHIVPHRDRVMRVITSSDVLFLNRVELAALMGGVVEDWRESASMLVDQGHRLRAVVVKAGPEGAALVTRSGVVERPAAPLDAVVDPTGAGDALAGGFLGHCARAQRDDDETMVAALEEGLIGAARAISQFGTEGLRHHSPSRP